MAIVNKTMHKFNVVHDGDTNSYEIVDKAGRKMSVQRWEDNSAKAFTAGEYIEKDGKFYKFKTNHTAGSAWSASEVVETNIGSELTDLKLAFKQSTGNEMYSGYTDGKYIKTNDTTANIGSMTSNTSYVCAVIDANYGDQFTITGRAGDAPRLWAFLGAESNGTRPVLDKAASSANETNKLITAPEGTQKLVVNFNKEYNPNYYLIYKKLLESRVVALELNEASVNTEITAIKKDYATKEDVGTYIDNPYIHITDSGYLTTSGDSVNDITAITPSSNWKHVIVDCSYGDQFVITGKGGASPRLWAFLGLKTVSDVYTVLSKADSYADEENLVITGPLNTQKLVINVSVEEDFQLIKNTYITNRVKDIEDDLYDYETLSASIAENGKYLSYNNNANTDAGACYTDYVPVIPGRTVKLSGIYVGSSRAVCGYNVNKEFTGDNRVIITGNASPDYNFVVPDGIYFIRITGRVNVAPTVYQSKPSIKELKDFYTTANIIIPSRFRKNIIQKKIVTLIDDDCDNETEVTNLKTLCDQLGIKCTIAAVTKLMANDASHMQFVKNLQNNGFHIANHTNDHTRWYESTGAGDMFTLAECEEDLLKAFKIFDENGFVDSAKYFVYTGDSSTRQGIPELIKKWCECAATISGGVNIPTQSGRFQLNRVLITPESSHDLNYYKNLLDEYESLYGDFWQIYYGHCKYVSTGGYSYELTGDVLENAMSKGYVPMTLNQAWNYMKSKYMIQEAFAT